MSIALYNELTSNRTRFVRVDELCRLAGERGALPSAPDLEAEARLPLKQKKGFEREQGRFLAEILADPACGETDHVEADDWLARIRWSARRRAE